MGVTHETSVEARPVLDNVSQVWYTKNMTTNPNTVAHWPMEMEQVEITLVTGRDITGQVRGYNNGNIIIRKARKTTEIAQHCVISWRYTNH